MKTADEIVKYLIEKCLSDCGDIVLDNMDFVKAGFNGKIYIRNLKANNDIYFSGAKSGGIIEQCKQEAKGNIYQCAVKSDKNVFQYDIEAKDSIYQFNCKAGRKIDERDNQAKIFYLQSRKNLKKIKDCKLTYFVTKDIKDKNNDNTEN